MTDAATFTQVPSNRLPLSASMRDTLTLAKRNVKRLIRTPQLLAFSTIQPVMFVLLFTYVFGGAIVIPGWDGTYADFLIPGIMVQTVAFGSSASAIGIAGDLQNGIIDRFRSLPMARGAVLTGRTISDSARHAFVVALVTCIGLLVGFRFNNGVFLAIGAFFLIVAFGFAMSWLFAFVGMSVRDPETAQVAGFLPIFPLVFLAGAFSPLSALPDWLEAVARHLPLTQVVASIRAMTQGGPLAAHLIPAILWIIGMTLFFGTLAVRKYRRVA